MSEIKTYTLNNYKPGETTFEVALGDIFTVPKGETLKNIDYVSISNTGIAACNKSGMSTATKFIFTPTSNIKEPNHKYDVTVKFTLTTEVTAKDSSVSTKTRNCFIKLILTPEINDDVSKLNVINYMGKLSPDEYMKEHSLKDDLDSLVTKKALITNLKEFGKQISNKVSNVQVFAIRYDLEGGNWDKGNEGRTSFVNSISYVAPAPVKTGYTFVGWKLFRINDDKNTAAALNAENINTDSMIPVGTNFDVLCVADWRRISYELEVYDASDSVSFNPKDVDYSENSKLNDITIIEKLDEEDEEGNPKTNTIKLLTPEKTGYIFKYWTTLDKYGQEIICKNDQHINEIYDQIFDASNDNISRLIELKPHFDAKVFTLHYKLNSNNAKLDGDSTNDIKDDKYVYGTTFTLPVPRRNGYKFNGWTINSLTNQFIINPNDFENVTSDTVEIEASWSAATFHLDFDLQGGILVGNNNYTLEPSKQITLGNPVKTGYDFTGWSCNVNEGSITKDEMTGKYKFTPKNIIDHDVTLVALWEAAKQTGYTLQIWEETVDSTGSFVSNTNDTCVYRLIKAINKTGTTNTSLGLTAADYSEKLGYKIPGGFELSKVVDTTIKADGTSIAAIYIHRKECSITVIDEYDTTASLDSKTTTKLYRTTVNSVGTTTSSNVISGKYGQTLLVYPIFNETYPELGYTCNTSGVSLVFGVDESITFNYIKKNVKVTFDLNNAGSWKVNNSTFNSDIYSIDVPYDAKIDSSHIPTVTNADDVETSKWTIESNTDNSVIDNIEDYKFTKDTTIRRTYSYYSNSIDISTENYDESDFTIANVVPAKYYKNNKISSSVRPIELLKPSFEAYNFVGYKYSFGTEFNNNYITAITRDIYTNTSKNNNLKIKACFERKEPTLDLNSNSTSVTYSNGTLTVQGVTLKAGATEFYISSTAPNTNVNTNLGNKSISNDSGTVFHATIEGTFSTDKNHNTIVIIPAKTYNSKVITGKPFIGTISSISKTNVIVNWVQSYQVYDNQEDASITSISTTNDGTHTNIDDKTSIIASTNAEKVLVNKGGELSIEPVKDGNISITIDNYSLGDADGTDKRNQESNEIIQLTPIKYNKTGKSAILDIKKTSTMIKKSESDIIAFSDSNEYYDKSDNYNKVYDTLGLSTTSAMNHNLSVSNNSAITIPNLASTAPDTTKNKKLDSITYGISFNNNLINNDGTLKNKTTHNSLNCTLYNNNGEPIRLLYIAGAVDTNVSVATNTDTTHSKVAALSDAKIDLSSVANEYAVNNINISISCSTATYVPSTKLSGGLGYLGPSYNMMSDYIVISLENKSISTPSINIEDIIKCSNNKYFKISLGDNFYTVNNAKLTSCTTAYIKCSDLPITGVIVSEITSNTTNICTAPTVNVDNSINDTNKALFIKKDGGTEKLAVNIPIKTYNSITYNIDSSKVGTSLKTAIENTTAMTESFSSNNVVLRDDPLISSLPNNDYITYNSISIDNFNNLEVNYKYATVRRDYESYSATIVGQYL